MFVVCNRQPAVPLRPQLHHGGEYDSRGMTEAISLRYHTPIVEAEFKLLGQTTPQRHTSL